MRKLPNKGFGFKSPATLGLGSQKAKPAAGSDPSEAVAGGGEAVQICGLARGPAGWPSRTMRKASEPRVRPGGGRGCTDPEASSKAHLRPTTLAGFRARAERAGMGALDATGHTEDTVPPSPGGPPLSGGPPSP